MNSLNERIQQALTTLKQGGMILVMDDESRENEGDLIMAAEFATQSTINFMIAKARGLVCAPLLKTHAQALGLVPMCPQNEDSHQTAFTVSVDFKSTHTGISAIERAITLRELANPHNDHLAFNRPGHVFPLIAQNGGVLERRGHTEAAIDLMQLADLTPVAVICEVLNEDGTMARKDDLLNFSKQHELPFLTIQEIVEYRKSLFAPLSQAHLPTDFGAFDIYTFPNDLSPEPHVVLIKQNSDVSKPATLRIHSECLTGDIFGSRRCDCQAQLHFGLKTIAAAEHGMLIYLRQEGRGIGLVEKIKAYALQEQGQNTIEANLSLGHFVDERSYLNAIQILNYFKINEARLITNNPLKIDALNNNGINVIERIQSPKFQTDENSDYLAVKAQHMGHFL